MLDVGSSRAQRNTNCGGGVGGPRRIGGRCGVNLKIRYRAAMNGVTVASAAAGLGRNHQADALRYRVQQKQRSPGWLQ